jgi:hypothetical protein
MGTCLLLADVIPDFIALQARRSRTKKRSSYPHKKTFNGHTVWEGVIEVFDLVVTI